MNYSTIRHMSTLRGQARFLPPKGDTPGHGELVFLITPDRDASFKVLSDPFIRFRESLYRFYFTDLIYRTRIGKTRIYQNYTSDMKKAFSNENFSAPLRLIMPASKKAHFSKNLNSIIDLGTWIKIFLDYRYFKTPEMICIDFFKFLSSKISGDIYENYHKILYIPIDIWQQAKTESFGIQKKFLNDPISILLLSSYRYPDLIKGLGENTDIVIIDTGNREILKIQVSQLLDDDKIYTKLKTQLRKLKSFKYIEDDDIAIDTAEPEAKKPVGNLIPSIIDKTPSKSDLEKETDRIADKVISSARATTDEAREKFKIRLINQVKKNLLGPPNDEEIADFTLELDGDVDDTEIIHVNDEMDDEIDNAVSAFIDKNPDILEKNEDEAKSVIEKEVVKKVISPKYVPQRTIEELRRIDFLEREQSELLKKVAKSRGNTISEHKKRIIQQTDLTKYINTRNSSLESAKFMNFTKDYNDKLLPQDIDNTVAMLANAQIKAFVVDKKEEDTSDQLNLKKTLTYTLRDERGIKHTLKFDIPIIIEDRYVYLNGNKRLILNQFILKPVCKTAPDIVQLVSSSYRKIFIKRIGDTIDLKSNGLKKVLITTPVFKTRTGNTYIKNKMNGYKTPIDFDVISKNVYESTVGEYRIIFDLYRLREVYESLDNAKSLKDVDGINKLMIGYNTRTKDPLLVDLQRGETVADTIISLLPSEYHSQLSDAKTGRKAFSYAEGKILGNTIPMIYLMLYYEPFDQVMKKIGVNYTFQPDSKGIGKLNQASVKLKDGVLVWDRYPIRNSIILNGLYRSDLSEITYEDLHDKEAIWTFLADDYKMKNTFGVDEFYDFFVDPITKEVLEDHEQPTDFVELLIYACGLLATNMYIPENNISNARLRNTEAIAAAVYSNVVKAYDRYRRSSYKKKPVKISMNPNVVIMDLMTGLAMDDASVLNPILEIEKTRAVSFKGQSGINKEDSYTLPKRAYDKSMVGVVGISTSPDANVGIVRQLTLEPNITSTRGYIDITSMDNVDNLTGANLFTPAELLSPPGVMHDDAQRTSMAYKQSKYMVLVDDASPVLVGNKVEAAMPYLTSREFTIVAKKDGVIKEVSNGIVVMEYKDGTYDSFSTEPKTQKNGAGGFYIQSIFKFDMKVGDTFKEGEVVAYNPKAYTKNRDDRSASMNIGVLTKLAIVPNFDEYEDSAPITKKLANQLSTEMMEHEEISLKKHAVVDKIVSIGDKVSVGDPLIVFDNALEDPSIIEMLRELREKNMENIIESNMTTVRASVSGEIADIKIYTTVPVTELSESLQKIVKSYHNKLRKKEKLLSKYQNENDNNFYKCGQLLTESTEVVKTNTGKVKGVMVGDGVLIQFFIKFKDIVKKGDKVTNYTALKGIVSHVIEEGYEPFGEYRPDEEISILMAPGAVLARKTPSVILAMFSNKIIIELKRHLSEEYLGE